MLHENDPLWHADPLWYDRAEPDDPPGIILHAAAYLFSWIFAFWALAMRIYWFPEHLWVRLNLLTKL